MIFMITFSFLNQTLWCDPHRNWLSETIPMSGNIIGFGWEIRKLAFWKLSILDLICCPDCISACHHRLPGRCVPRAVHHPKGPSAEGSGMMKYKTRRMQTFALAPFVICFMCYCFGTIDVCKLLPLVSWLQKHVWCKLIVLQTDRYTKVVYYCLPSVNSSSWSCDGIWLEGRKIWRRWTAKNSEIQIDVKSLF